MRMPVSDSQIDKIAQIAERISAEENRRTRQSDVINSLLQERQQVLVSMCELAELEAGEVPEWLPSGVLEEIDRRRLYGRSGASSRERS